MAGERDPLLSSKPRIDNSTNVVASSAKSQIGPLDISKSCRRCILVGLWCATFLSGCGLLTRTPWVAAAVLPSISSEFNASNQASWLGTSYLLAGCTFTPLYGRLSDVLGRRNANQLAVCMAAMGTLLCGCSHSMNMLIFARFLAGMGGGGLSATCSIITSDMYSIRSRGMTQGIANVFSGLGLSLGGPVGGLVSEWFGWRWAFWMQMPIFASSLALTAINLNYVTPGKGKGVTDVLKRIDYGGMFTLLISIGSCLVFLSEKYNEQREWNEPRVFVPLCMACTSFVLFVLVELLFAREPLLAPSLLRQRVPVLVGTSNFFVAMCNFSVTYFLPMWFQTVAMTSAATAGMHLAPNSIAMSTGSLFAGWMMHRTGRYKLLNSTFGILPFVGIILITLLREDSPAWQQWFSIVPLGFGNAIVFQTVFIALLAHLPPEQMAVGTGFGQVFRGLGQVGGVAISSAVFQSKLDTELHRRIGGPNAEEATQIRHSSLILPDLPRYLQDAARDAYATSLRVVFVLAACSTLVAYCARIPVSRLVSWYLGCK
ncbi:major facilitator superfamily domain-containing protein [Melanogaster broomeanus]|nr:major facilitator superfamily domain-containing protein [Melanogaster broomeanus]